MRLKPAFVTKPLYRAWKDLLQVFYPRVCLTCEALLHDSEEILCHNCLSELAFTEFDFSKNNPVYAQLASVVKIEYATSMFVFHESGVIQKLIHQLKYKGHQEAGELIAGFICNKHRSNPRFSTVDYIVPVPLHKKKLKKRGYNQLTVLGQNLEKCLDIEYHENILIRKVHTGSQTKKTVEERRKNVARVFDILEPEKYRGKHFLIIDDVMTTGATTEACAETVLSKIPQAQVSILTIAVVYHT